MTTLSFVGIIIALTLLCYMMYKGGSPAITIPIAIAIVSLTSGLNFADMLTGPFLEQTMALAKAVGLMFIFSCAFAEVMLRCGCAESVAKAIIKVAGGPKYVCWIVLVCLSIMAVGGMGQGAYLVIYPIGCYLCREMKYSRSILLGCMTCATWTYAMTGPFVATPHNIYAMNFLGTGPDAGLLIGIVSDIVMFVAGGLYLTWQAKRWQKKGKGWSDFDEQCFQKLNFSMDDTKKGPSFFISIIPIIVVMLLFNVANMNIAVAMIGGILVCLVLNFKRMTPGEWWKSLGQGATKGMVPIFSLALVGGLGAVIAQTSAYAFSTNFLSNLQLNPYLVVCIVANLLSLFLGSASGGISLMLTTMMPVFQKFIDAGTITAGNLHRLMCIASGGLDSLPNSGPLSSLNVMFDFTNEEAYFPVFITCTAIPLIVTFFIALPMAMMGL